MSDAVVDVPSINWTAIQFVLRARFIRLRYGAWSRGTGRHTLKIAGGLTTVRTRRRLRH